MEFFGICFWIVLTCGIGLLIYKKFAESRRGKRDKFAPLIERTLLQIEEDQGEDLDDDPDESWIEAKKRVTAFITELDSKESVKG